MNPRVGILVAVGAVAGRSLFLSPASGQTHDPSVARTLNDHTFIPSTIIDDPFITTLVRTQTGGGFATKVSRDVENEVVDSLIQVLVGDLAFMSLEFEYQHAVTDWLALSASASGAARIGTGAQSVLAEGITSNFGFSPRAAAGLGGAYAPRPWPGFVASGNLGYADTLNSEGRNDPAWDLGGLADFDLNPLYGLPPGFLVSVKQDAFVVANSDITQQVMALGWGVAYTGRSDFSLSLETSHMRVPLIQSDRTNNATLVGFNPRYFFEGDPRILLEVASPGYLWTILLFQGILV